MFTTFLGDKQEVRIASFPSKERWEDVSARLQEAGVDWSLFTDVDNPVRPIRKYGRDVLRLICIEASMYTQFLRNCVEVTSLIGWQKDLIRSAGFDNCRFDLAIPNIRQVLAEEMWYPKSGVDYNWPPAGAATDALTFFEAATIDPHQFGRTPHHLAVTLEWRQPD